MNENESVVTRISKILYIDRYLSMRLLVGDTLRDAGYSYALAQDGIEAWELTKQTGGGFDLIISNLYMERMSGLELLRLLREEGVKSRFILLSSETIPTNVETIRAECDRLGAEFFSQSLTPAQLESWLPGVIVEIR